MVQASNPPFNAGAFHARLIDIRGSIAKDVASVLGSKVVHVLVTKAMEDTIVVLFLASAGFVRIDGGRREPGELISGVLLQERKPIDRVATIIDELNCQPIVSCDSRRSGPTIKLADPQLFDKSWMAAGSREIITASMHWQDLLVLFKEYRWSIKEGDAAGTGDIPTITPAIFGALHELDLAGDAAPGSKKNKGVYYTPPAISRYICRRSIHEFLARSTGLDGVDSNMLVDRAAPGKLPDIMNALDHVHVLDPSCGTGEFLVAAAEIIASLKQQVAKRLNPASTGVDFPAMAMILSNNIFGAELSAEAIIIAKRRLWLWSVSCLDNERVDSLANVVLPSLDEHIINGNALIGWLDEQIDNSLDAFIRRDHDMGEMNTAVTSKLSRQLERICREHVSTKVDLAPYHPLHWRIVFHELFQKNGSQGFDIVIGNPPYVFIRGNNFDETERCYYSTWYFQGIVPSTRGKSRQSGKINTFSLFLARSIKLLKKGGILGFIVPNTILRTTTSDVIRKLIVTSAIVEEIVDLQDGVFSGVVASTVILILAKEIKDTNDHRVLVKHGVQDLGAGVFQSHLVDQARFLTNPACVFDIHVDDQFARIFKKMQTGSFCMGDICSQIIEGLVTRRGDELFTSDPTKPKAKKLLRGKDIDRYCIHWRPDQYIIFEPSLLHRPRPVIIHEAPAKLVAQRIGGGAFPLRVAYDDRQYYVFASINAIILNDPPRIGDITYGYKYILAILNSTLMNAFYLLNFSNKSSLTVNVSKTFLENLAIKPAEPRVQSCISTLVDYLLVLHEHAIDEKEIISFLDAELLDALIFTLYMSMKGECDIAMDLEPHLEAINIKKDAPRAMIAVIKKVASRISADKSCMENIRRVQENVDFKAIKGLFEQRTNNPVD
jgi:adenine-specific DNA-methyltransferase